MSGGEYVSADGIRAKSPEMTSSRRGRSQWTARDQYEATWSACGIVSRDLLLKRLVLGHEPHLTHTGAPLLVW